MYRVMSLVFMLFVSLFALAPVVEAQGPTVPDKAQVFVSALQAGKYDVCDSMLSGEIRDDLKKQNIGGMGSFFTIVEGQVGPLKSIGRGYAIDAPKGSSITLWPCDFTLMPLDFQLVMNDAGTVIGFFMKPHTEVRPEVSQEERYTETIVKLGDPKQPVPAAVVVPGSVKNFPVVVMLTGSGTQDMDETIGRNKPFKDLALGLAAKGIASIRFDKRTRVYGVGPRDVNMIDWEYMQDAKAAIAMAKELPGANKVLVLGHSEGAILAPAVAAENKGVAGVICLAGSVTNLVKIVEYQYRHLASLGKIGEKDAKVVIADCEAYISGTPNGPTIIGLPVTYLQQLEAKGNPAVVAKSLGLPVFVQFGARDYQVPPTEMDEWKKIVGNSEGFTFKIYPEMNHILMNNTGTPNPDEYLIPGHVAPELLEDLTVWVNRLE